MNPSAGILLYRKRKAITEVFIVHPGGPYWRNKDMGVWSIPKGEFHAGEAAILAAKREFQEETGMEANGKLVALPLVKMKSGKIIHAWAMEGDFDPRNLVSNNFEMEWPPKTGRMQSFPEVDRGEWFTMNIASVKIVPAQEGLIKGLNQLLKKKQ